MSTLFDNTNEGLSATVFSGNAAYAIAFWAYPTSFNGDNHIVSISDGTDGNFDWLGIYTGANRYYLATIGGPSYSEQTGGSPATNTWQHIAVVRESTTALRLYINGSLITSNTTNIGSRSGITTFRIGSFNTTYYFSGRVFGLKLWNASLTADQVKNEVRSIAPIKKTNLYSWYPLIPSMPRTTDFSGRGITLSAGGTLSDADNPSIAWLK